jgi:hypothetical protein
MTYRQSTGVEQVTLVTQSIDGAPTGPSVRAADRTASRPSSAAARSGGDAA